MAPRALDLTWPLVERSGEESATPAQKSSKKKKKKKPLQENPTCTSCHDSTSGCRCHVTAGVLGLTSNRGAPGLQFWPRLLVDLFAAGQGWRRQVAGTRGGLCLLAAYPTPQSGPGVYCPPPAPKGLYDGNILAVPKVTFFENAPQGALTGHQSTCRAGPGEKLFRVYVSVFRPPSRHDLIGYMIAFLLVPPFDCEGGCLIPEVVLGSVLRPNRGQKVVFSQLPGGCGAHLKARKSTGGGR
ncbi:hypothetical protein GWK47_025756 [Chionoecetes opilio]|uniref:Uncharacterized protein n=1 Tax=Chionoecetes opilio TaxID=41210 RepID=A0A8J8WLG3_CHIOP|nr:hypothetical protein GWK47_025756 [Chionoecetes opilio]